MSKFWIIFKSEYGQVVRKKSFIVGIFLTPLLMATFTILPTLLADTKATESEKLAIIDQGGQGVGKAFSEGLNEYKLEDSVGAYYSVTNIFTLESGDSEEYQRLRDSLDAEINEKNILYLLVVRPDAHLNDSNVFLVTNSDKIKSLNRFERVLTDILSSKRLSESNVNMPVDSVLHLTRQLELGLQDTQGESIPFFVKYMGAIVFVMLTFTMIITYGQMVMRSVIEEKNSRIMEVLISSVSPFQLMFGKLMGLGAAAFTQVLVWVSLGALLFVSRGMLGLNIDSSIDRLLFNPVIIFFFVAFLITGYIMYSSIFALIGSIVNTEKEAQNFIFPITMSLILPMMVAIAVIQEPHSVLAMTLAFIPFFTPTMMIMRIIFIAPTVTEYSLFSGIVGEALLGLILVILTSMVIVWLTSRIFRVGILMYGKRPTLPELVKWVKY
ncbi:MAG: ABC transporter permease [candidate division Zixibacteria bacterium]|nr:ABC transporter permease [candidate division Zixibacteria bacterium]